MRMISKLLALIGVAAASLMVSTATASAAPRSSSSHAAVAAAVNGLDPSVGSCGFTSIQPTISFGSTGPAVAEAQCLLNEHGFIVDIDGIFGSQTLAGVRAFQRSAGIVVDGIVGPVTWFHLSTFQM